MRSIKFDDYYEVYENGSVCSLDRQINGKWYHGKLLKPHYNNERGYRVHCRLSTGEDKYIYVGKLVYSAFHGKGDIMAKYEAIESEVIIHKDGNLANNDIKNLELASKGAILNESVAKNKRIKANLDK